MHHMIKIGGHHLAKEFQLCMLKLRMIKPRPGSVVVERSSGMREVGGLIPGRVKQKTLKFEVLLLCLALSTKRVRDRQAGSKSE